MNEASLITLSIVLPTYNECVNVPLMVAKLEACLTSLPFEIIIVDDNSPDGTWKIAEELSETRPHLRVIRRLHDNGLSSAVLAGFEAARGKFLAVMDADMQHDENALHGFLDSFSKGADIVVGSRKVEGGKVEDWSVIRRFVSFAASLMAKTILTRSVTDPMSGFFAMRKEVYQELGSDINPRGFKILLEFIARAKNKNIVEVGYTFRGRVHGESKLSTNVIFDYLAALYDLSYGKYLPRRFLKYVVVGLSGVFVNTLGVWLGRNALGLQNSSALMLGIETSIVTNFALNNYWTFRSARLRGFVPLVRGFVTFNTICLGGAAINYAIALFLSDRLSLSIYLANFVGILMATLWNYIVNSQVTWTAKNDD